MKFLNSKKTLFLLAGFIMGFGWLFRIKLLMALSLVEFNIFSQDGKNLSGLCNPEVAYHRGYANNQKYKENSTTSLDAAVKDGIEKVEVDISIKGSDIFVGHDLSLKDFSWEDFLVRYDRKLKTLIVDIKEVHEFAPKTVNDLLKAKSKFDHVIYIGRKCDLLNELSIREGEVSCESMGLIAHEILGWKWWSIDHRRLGSNYKKLLSYFPKKVLTWTFPDSVSFKNTCQINPTLVLIEKN
jgi:hypothetical protein